MRILYLSGDPGIRLETQGGGAIHVRQFIGALTDLGHDPTLVCTSKAESANGDADWPCPVHRSPIASWNDAIGATLRAGNRLLGRTGRRHPDLVRALHNVRFAQSARAVARKCNPHFIYERYALWGMSGLWLARQRAVPLVLEVNAPLVDEQRRYRGLSFPAVARAVERTVWQRADLVIAVSESLRDRLCNAGIAADRIRVLPNAVDKRAFTSDVDGTAVRRRFHLDDRFVVGFVGTFKRWHGADLLLTAFQALHANDPWTQLLLVGDGPLRASLEAQVRELELAGAVTFAGEILHEEVPRHLAAMDVVVAPYPAIEDFYYSPLKLLEYLAAGRAVIASRIGQVAEIITSGHNGLLVAPGDTGALAAALQRLRSDSTLRDTLGRNAGATSTSTWSANAARVIQWVEPLVERMGRSGAGAQERGVA